MAGRKANFLWESAVATWGSTAASANSFSSLGTFTRAGTLRRMIVDFWVMGSAITDGANWSGRVGLIIVSPRVASVGATAVPLPLTNGERPWLWNRGYAGIQQLIGGTVEYGKYIPLHLHDDVRGMRKYKEQDVLVCVIENLAGDAISTHTGVRFLEST